MAATNREVRHREKQWPLREDLFFRLCVFQFRMPSLRERRDEIPSLARFFQQRYSVSYNLSVEGVGWRAMERLKRYEWPGNIRELENVMHRAVILASPGRIRERHLPDYLAGEGCLEGFSDFRSGKELEHAVNKAFIRSDERIGLASSVDCNEIVRFLVSTRGRPFAPRDFAASITPPGKNRRDRLSGRILKQLLDAGVVGHNGRSAQAARFRLTEGYLN